MELYQFPRFRHHNLYWEVRNQWKNNSDGPTHPHTDLTLRFTRRTPNYPNQPKQLTQAQPYYWSDLGRLNYLKGTLNRVQREMNALKYRKHYDKRDRWNGDVERYDFLLKNREDLRQEIEQLQVVQEEISTFFEAYKSDGFCGELEGWKVEDVDHLRAVVEKFDRFYAQAM